MELKPALWVLKHQIKNEVGTPIDFTKRKYLVDIYNDLSPLQVILKPPQVGMTVANTLKSLYVAKKKARQIIYTLPTEGDIRDMVGGSFNRIIAQNPILSEWVKDHDTVEQKQVGNSMIFYRGTFTQKQAMMIPSGLNIHDEVDASDSNVITQYETRLQAQEDGGWRWYFSHPSLAGHGVDVYWQQSDKKEWYVKCTHCGEEQILTWPDSISIERESFVCKNCARELSTDARINGTWKPTGTGDFSGYHISQLMLYNKSAKDIVKAYNDPLKTKQYFYNYVLGLPYTDSSDRIEPSIVLKNCVDTVNEQKGVITLGADTGHGIHYVLMNSEGVFYYDHVTEHPYQRIKDLMKRFPTMRCVFDQGGDLIGVRELQKDFPGRVFLCWFRPDRKTNELAVWGTDEKYGEVVVDRNRMMSWTVEQLKDIGRFRLNGTREEWAEFASHYGNIYREVIETNETKGKDDPSLYGNKYVWKRNGPDHFCFALLYALVGFNKWGGEQAKVSNPGGFVGLENAERAYVVDPEKGMSLPPPGEWRVANDW